MRLGDVAEFVNDKIETSKLTTLNYLSTENMLPNKEGIVESNGLPTINSVTLFKNSNILISNIRPYFKKIWFADRIGGCSNDVLIFRAKEDIIEEKYLYYILSYDGFFDYTTATSKGTKMPRGDKDAIMNYELYLPSLPEQKSISNFLSAIDDKIEINSQINKKIEETTQAIFKSWFVDFEPFQSGEFQESEMGRIPKGWNVGKLGEIVEISSGKRPIAKNEKMDMDFSIPLVGASSIMGYVNDVLYNEPILVIGRVGTHGVIQRFISPCWPSDNTLVLKSKFYEFVYEKLKSIDYKSLNRGSTQPLITQTDIKNVKLVLPSDETMKEFENIVSKIYEKYNSNNNENRTLVNIRDSLLPKLINGEIRVSEVL